MARGAPYTSQKLRNDLRKLDPNLKVEVKPVKVNGAVFGCSGFVTNPANGVIVYVSTDHNHGMMYDKALYRTAKSTRDYTGGQNRICSYADLTQNVVNLLRIGDRGASSYAAAQQAAADRRTEAVKRMSESIRGVTFADLLITQVSPLNDPRRPGVFKIICANGDKYSTEQGSPFIQNMRVGVFDPPRKLFATITPRGTIRQLR